MEVVTVSLRRESGAALAGQGFWSLIRGLGVRVLPNTAGCHSAKEAVTTAQMAREVFGTPWIKLEVIGHHDTLQPDVFELVEAVAVTAYDETVVRLRDKADAARDAGVVSAAEADAWLAAAAEADVAGRFLCALIVFTVRGRRP